MGRKFYTFLRLANVCQRQCLSRWSLDRTQWLSTMTAACNNKSRFSGLAAHMCCFVKIHQFGFAGGRRRGGREPGSGCYLSTVTGEQRYQFRLLSVHGPPPPPLLSTDSARFTPTVFAVHPCTEDLIPPPHPAAKYVSHPRRRRRFIRSRIARRSRQTGAKLLSLVLLCKSFSERPRV